MDENKVTLEFENTCCQVVPLHSISPFQLPLLLLPVSNIPDSCEYHAQLFPVTTSPRNPPSSRAAVQHFAPSPRLKQRTSPTIPAVTRLYQSTTAPSLAIVGYQQGRIIICSYSSPHGASQRYGRFHGLERLPVPLRPQYTGRVPV